MGGAAVPYRLFGVTLRRVRPWIGFVLLLAAGGLVARGASGAGGHGFRMRAGGICDTAVAAAPALCAVSRAAAPGPGNPFGAVAAADGRGGMLRPLGSRTPVSSNATTPLQSRLHPCSG